MGASDLTTKDVARLLQVSEATVKRWADEGLLVPNKTAGGHRRFNIQNVGRFKRERGILPPSPKLAGSGTRKAAVVSVERFTQLLLRGDTAEIEGSLISAYLENHDLAGLFDSLVTNSMHRIGDMWFNGTATVADEHLASRVLLRALQKLRPVVIRREPVGANAICCGIEGDLHEIPIHLAEIIVEAQGWQTANLGPNTPLFALRDMASHYKPRLICIAARTVADLDRATSDYAQLRKVTDKAGTKLVVGGEAFRDRAIRERFPAEFYGMDFRALSKFMNSLVTS